MLPPPEIASSGCSCFFEFIILANSPVDAWMSSEEAFRQDLGYFVLIALRFPRPMSWYLLRRQLVSSPKPTKNKSEIQNPKFQKRLQWAMPWILGIYFVLELPYSNKQLTDSFSICQ